MHSFFCHSPRRDADYTFRTKDPVKDIVSLATEICASLRRGRLKTTREVLKDFHCVKVLDSHYNNIPI